MRADKNQLPLRRLVSILLACECTSPVRHARGHCFERRARGCELAQVRNNRLPPVVFSWGRMLSASLVWRH